MKNFRPTFNWKTQQELIRKNIWYNLTTINEWIRKYEHKDLMNTRIKVETKDKITRIKELQKEIEQLKKAFT